MEGRGGWNEVILSNARSFCFFQREEGEIQKEGELLRDISRRTRGFREKERDRNKNFAYR